MQGDCVEKYELRNVSFLHSSPANLLPYWTKFVNMSEGGRTREIQTAVWRCYFQNWKFCSILKCITWIGFMCLVQYTDGKSRQDWEGFYNPACLSLIFRSVGKIDTVQRWMWAIKDVVSFSFSDISLSFSNNPCHPQLRYNYLFHWKRIYVCLFQ